MRSLLKPRPTKGAASAKKQPSGERSVARFSAGWAVAPAYESSGNARAWAELEGWRVVAAMCVVFVHGWQQVWNSHPGRTPPAYRLYPEILSLDLSLDLFFMVSGLVLSYPYLRALVDGPGTSGVDSYKGFLIQRFLRAAPAYYIVIIFVWASRNYNIVTADWLDLFEHLTFTQWLDSERIFYTVGPTWSIAVEMWMYPLIPLVYFGVRRFVRGVSGRSKRVLVASVIPGMLVVVGLVFKGLGYYVWHIPHSQKNFWYSLPSKVDDLGIGILLALVVVCFGKRRIPVWASRLCRLVGMFTVGFIFAYRFERLPTRTFLSEGALEIFVHPLGSLGLAVFLLPTLVGRRTDVISKVVGSRPLVWAGGLTYSLYLIHEPILEPLTNLGWFSLAAKDMFRDWMLYLPISMLVAVGFYLLVEWPFMRIRASFDRSTGAFRDYYPHLRNVKVGREGPVLPTMLPARAQEMTDSNYVLDVTELFRPAEEDWILEGEPEGHADGRAPVGSDAK